MGWLQSIRRALWSVGSSTYDAVHAKNKRQAPTGILRSEDSELPPTEPVVAPEAGKLIAAQPWRGLRGSGVALR